MALVGTVALVGGPLTLPNARADDLRDKKAKVQRGVKHAQSDLEDSSKAFAAASAKLRTAQSKLATAQQRYAKTQGELTAARVLDTQMQAKLVTAQAALVTAEQELAAGEAKVLEQRAAIGRLAVDAFQLGDPNLMRMSVLLKGSTPEEMVAQVTTVDSLMARESGTYDDLKATEALLTAQRNRVETAKVAVAAQRQEAAVNLARKKTLEAQAATSRAQVASLVTARAGAATAAQAARASDLRKLRQLKKEEARIQRLIVARAKQHSGGGYSGNSGGFLYPPVPGGITSPFGYRVHPIYGYYSLHDGTDYHAPCGTPLHAGAAGTVISKYYSEVWGNRLILDVGRVNGKSMTLIYNHLSSYRAGEGERVKRGEVIGYSGTTGWSTGCHLHFTVLVNGNPVNPQNYL